MKRLPLLFLFAALSFGAGRARALDITVTGTTDSAGTCVSGVSCSLREAIMLANATPGADTITLGEGAVYTLSVGPADSGETGNTAASGDLDITDSVTFEGNGARIDAAHIDRAFDIRRTTATPVTVSMSSLWIENGAPKGFQSGGGGIAVRGANLTLTSCLVSSNSTAETDSTDNGGAIAVNAIATGAAAGPGSLTVHGGAIGFNTGFNGGAISLGSSTAILDHCILSSNTSTATGEGGGGAVFLSGTAANLDIQSCLMQLNSATKGGAVWVFDGTFNTHNSIYLSNSGTGAVRTETGTATVSSSTFTDNTGGSISAVGLVSVNNTILDDSSSLAGNVTSGGYNLSSDAGGGKLTGTGDIINTDPMLDVVDSYGGVIDTISLLPGSPAINKGDPAITGAGEFDMRGAGFARVINGRIDIGAFEYPPLAKDGLSVTIAPGQRATVSETAGAAATKVRVTRNGSTTDALVVALRIPSGPRLKIQATATIPAGATAVDVPVDAIDNTLIDGTTEYIVRASAAGTTYVFDPAGVIMVTDNDGTTPALTATLTPSTFNEDATTSVALTVTHNRADTSTAVVVALSSDETRFTLPASVTIPAGKRIAKVNIPFVADAVNGGTVLRSIVASSGGFTDGNAEAIIHDSLADFTFTLAPGLPASFSETAGPVATLLRVTRNTPANMPAVVKLTVRVGAGQVTIPVTATVPAGQTFVDIAVSAVNDTAIDGTQRVIIDARADGYPTTRSVTLYVFDDDTAATLTAAISPTSFYENKRTAVTLTVSHDRADTSTAVPLALSSTDTRFTLPANVSIPAGKRSVAVQVPFAAGAATEGTLDSTINVAATHFTGAVATVTIYDVQAKLTAALAPNAPGSFSEGTAGTATTIRISRNTPTGRAVEVNLSLRQGAGQVTIPETATIPAGQQFVDVPVTAVNDANEDGTQRVIIEARAPGYASVAAISIYVFDNDTAPGLKAPAVSTVPLSTATADAKAGTVTLTFAGALGASAGDAARYTAAADEDLAVTGASRKGTSTVVLSVDDLQPGAVTVTYDITDAAGRTLQGTAQVTAK